MAEQPVAVAPKPMPEFDALRSKLEKERDEIEAKAAPHRKQREALLAQIQPLEAKLREVDAAIKAAEKPRLREVGVQLARLAVAMGGRSLKPGGGAVGGK